MTRPGPTPAGDPVTELPLRDSLGFLLRDTHRLVSRRLDERLQRAGLTLGEWYLLRALWERDGIAQRELAAETGMGPPNVHTALRSLEAAGFVEKRTDPADARRQIVTLTRHGRDARVELAPIGMAVNAVVAAPLSADERRLLADMLRRVRANLRREP